MKKILLLLCFLAAFFVSNAQYPVIQYLGRDSSLVDSRGGLKARLINYAFTDTTEANTQRISQYPGAMIYTTSGGDKLWLRSSDATLWTRVGTTSGGGSGIVSLGTSAYGLTIQNDSTYKVDTIQVSTRLWRQKGIDSVQSNIALKLNISDTANTWVTSVYRKTASDSVFLIKGGTHTFAYKDSISAGGGGGTVTSVGTGYGLSGGAITSSGTILVDSASLSNYYLRRKDSLTASNLLGYVTRTVLADSAAAIRSAIVGGGSVVDSIKMVGNEFLLYQTGGSDLNAYISPTILDIDSTYNPLAGQSNDSTWRLKSLQVQAYGTTQTPTITDSTLNWNITKVPPTKQSVTSTSDTIHLVNDSTSFVNSSKVYGYAEGTVGWKDTKKMTFTIPYTGEVVMISGDSLINGRKVDTMYRTVGKDSIIFNIAGTRYAIKDSTGGGGVPGGSTTQVQYNNAGAFAGSANMTFDGTMLTLPGSSTQSAIKAGTIEMQTLGVNNAWFGENVYYNAGWKTRATGYAPMFYFPTGRMEFQTIGASVAAGGAITPLTRLKIQTDGRISLGPNVGSLTATAYLHLANGQSTASNAPLKFYLAGSGILTTPEAGAVEALVDTLYYTGNAASRSKIGLVTAGSPFIASGIATPTATNGTNVSASTPGQTQYIRVGNTVTVSGYIDITCTSANITSQIDLTIPVASAFTNTTQLSGTMLEAVTGVASPGHGTVVSQATDDRLSIDFTPRATGSLSYRFTYTYQVL